jgi:MFS family permease
MKPSAATAIPDDRQSERVTRYAWKALAGSAIGYAMDGFDLLILSFMLPEITAALKLTTEQGGALVTWTLIGAVLGGIVFGALSDRYGRVRVLTWTILLFAVFTGLCAVAQGFWDLLGYRTVAGIGLGGEFGIGMTLAAEAWPASKRARVSSYVALGWQSGVLLAALLTPLLLAYIGWRGMFVVGVLPALLAWALRSKLHEPELFVHKGKMPAQKANSFKLLLAAKLLRCRSPSAAASRLFGLATLPGSSCLSVIPPIGPDNAAHVMRHIQTPPFPTSWTFFFQILSVDIGIKATISWKSFACYHNSL